MIVAMLPDQKRLYLQHGPIDLVIEAFGEHAEITKAYRAASERFKTVLDELVAELPLLRTHLRGNDGEGPIACAMFKATRPHAKGFITPMAAVAGAVADEILAVMCAYAKLNKAYVNNGGDIALYLSRDQNFQTGVVSDPRIGKLVTVASITADAAINGIATSGRHGRSHSLGIADSVTVFAGNAAIADAAATIVANHVTLPDCPAIERQPARKLSPDSDLGSQLVTVSVGKLSDSQIEAALVSGKNKAEGLCQTGLIKAAFLCLRGRVKIVQWPIDLSPDFVPQSITHQQQDRIAHA